MVPARCLDDVDDEVRDRAAMYVRVFKAKSLADAYVKEGTFFGPFYQNFNERWLLSTESVFSLAALESRLVAYVNDPAAAAQPFDSSSIPKISRAQLAAEASRKRISYCLMGESLTRCFSGPSTLDTIAVPTRTDASPPPPTAAETQSTYAQQLAEVAELADYGPVLNSSAKPVQLTETETEYQVTCVKHIFKEHIVFQVRSRSALYLFYGTDSGSSLMSRIPFRTPC